MKIMEVNREILTKAFHAWNNEFFENAENFGEIDNTIECAESQADKLILILESMENN